MSKNKGKFFKGFLLGSAVGTVLGMVFAPKSGREIRDDLTEDADRFVNKAKSEFNDARDAAVHSFESGKDSFMNKTQESEQTAKENPAPETKTEETPPTPDPEKKPKRRGRPPKKKVDA